MAAMSVAAYGSASAADNRVQRGPAPSWVVPSELMPVPENASGLVFVRRQDVVVHLNAKGQEHYLGYRMKILHPNALQAGNLSVAWNPSAGTPTVHAVNIHRDGEKIDALGKGEFDIMRREGQLEAAILDGVLTAVFRIPDLRVGDELEVAVTVPAGDPTMGRDTSGMLFLGVTPAAGRYRLAVNWEDGLKPHIKMTPDMAAIAETSDRGHQFRFDNPATITPPKDAPIRYRWQRIVEYSAFPDWETISRRFAPFYRDASKLAANSPLKQEAKRIANAHPDALDRARAALQLVQQNVRYIYVGLNDGNLVPVTAEETWQRRYGDCKGKTALLLVLLAELGIDAEAVLVNNSQGDDGLDDRLANPASFDHVLVRARIDGAVYWMDGTLPPAAPPSLEPVFPYRWVLPLSDRGQALEQIAWKPATRPVAISMYDIDARSGFDETARVTHTSITRGLKGLEQYLKLSALTPDQLTEGMRQILVGNLWRTIDDVKWRYDPSSNASILAVSGSWVLDWDDDGDGAKSYALPGGGFNRPERRVRPADQNQDLPYVRNPDYSCDVTTIRLPPNTKSESWSVKLGFDTNIFGGNYYRAMDIRDGAVRMVRGFRAEQNEIDAASAKKDNARIDTFDNSKAWIFYDPEDNNLADPQATKVPSTDEIDWTGDIVPCLSANTLGQ